MSAGRHRRGENGQSSSHQISSRFFQTVYFSTHLVSGWSTPSVSSSETWCRKPSCGEVDTTERPSPRKIGCRSCQFHLRNVSFWPLKAAIEKSSARMKASIFAGIGALRARRRLADDAHRRPGRHVLRQHAPAVRLGEAVLDLRAAPLLAGRMPGRGDQAGRTRDRPRYPGPERHIGAEHLALVGDQHDVVVGQVLGEDRHLPLDLDDAGIGPPGGAGILEHLLGDDLAAEARRRAAQRVGEKLVAARASRRAAPSAATASRSDIAPGRRPAWCASARCGTRSRGTPPRAGCRRSRRH